MSFVVEKYIYDLGNLACLVRGTIDVEDWDVSERVQVFISFEQMKSQSMKLPVALLSKRALMEWSSLVSVVPISTDRSKKVPCASKTLIERSLGSPLSHLGLWSGVGTRRMRGGASTSSLSIVLGSSIVNTVNLFTSNRGALIAGCITQNPLLSLEDKTLQSELYFLTPTNLQSAPPIVLRRADGHPCGEDSLGLSDLHLRISNILAEAGILSS